jgi:hypothetical protein
LRLGGQGDGGGHAGHGGGQGAHGQLADRERQRDLVGDGPHHRPAEEQADHQPQAGAEQGNDHRLPAHHGAHLAAGHADRS